MLRSFVFLLIMMNNVDVMSKMAKKRKAKVKCLSAFQQRK